MTPFYIIDWDRKLHLLFGESKATVKQEFDSTRKIIADVVVEACECKHNRYLKPAVPDWMLYKPIRKDIICPLCNKKKVKKKRVSREAKQLAAIKPPPRKWSRKYFEHNVNEMI